MANEKTMGKLLGTILFCACLFSSADANAQQWDSYDYTPHYTGMGKVFSEHEDVDWGINFGYVNKDWVTDFGGGDIYHENLWGEEGKKLHGIELGATYQPCSRLGFGLYTGLNMDLYFSLSDEIRNYSDGDEFTELGFYVPIHAMYRLPLGRKASLSIHGGLGIDLAVVGEFHNREDSYYDFETGDYYDASCGYLSYGRGEFPHHLNLSKEIAASLRINNIQLTATFSRGFTNHEFYSKDHVETNQNKFGLTLSVVY